MSVRRRVVEPTEQHYPAFVCCNLPAVRFQCPYRQNFIQLGCSWSKHVLRLIRRKKEGPTSSSPSRTKQSETRSAEEGRGLAWRAGGRQERRHGFDLNEPCDQER
ncbi:hypothetical protein ABVT39_021881 [Epinephelus coioides]